MAFIVGGKQINLNNLTEKEQPKVVPDIPKSEPPPKRVVFDRKPTPKITDGNTLIVNGKTKTIGRKSQYLLDMMIIDDE